MKKAALVFAVLFVSLLSFWAGGRYGEERSSGNKPQGEPVQINTIDDDSSSQVPGAVKISPARQQLIGAKVSTVEKKPMTYNLRLYGKVVPDETKIYRVNASTDCWIREISDVTSGSIIRKNQVLAEALAPAFYNAQLTYLLALNNIDRIRQQLGGETRHQQTDLADNQIRLAVQGLQNLGIGDAQVEELANTRQARPYLQVRSPTTGVVLNRKLTLNQWFKAGEEFYTIADIGRVWVYADVYEGEAIHMRPGMNVAVRHGQMGKAFKASVGQVLPLFDPAARTLKVRIDVDNRRYDLRPDMFVDVEIPIRMPASISLPADAVLDTGKRAVVYVDKGNGVFEPRGVKTGWHLGGQVEIIDGLEAGEKVVVSGNFLIDSESRMELTASRADVGASEDRQVRETNGTKRDSLDMPATERGWAEMLVPAGDKRMKGNSAKTKQKAAKGAVGKSAASPGVIDWDGPDKPGTPPRDWSGWGKFPGADYLGIKRQGKDNPSRQSNPTQAGGNKIAGKEQGSTDGTSASDTHCSEIESGTHDRQESDQPRHSTK